jgi:hypothetical protein
MKAKRTTTASSRIEQTGNGERLSRFATSSADKTKLVAPPKVALRRLLSISGVDIDWTTIHNRPRILAKLNDGIRRDPQESYSPLVPISAYLYTPTRGLSPALLPRRSSTFSEFLPLSLRVASVELRPTVRVAKPDTFHYISASFQLENPSFLVDEAIVLVGFNNRKNASGLNTATSVGPLDAKRVIESENKIFTRMISEGLTLNFATPEFFG